MYISVIIPTFNEQDNIGPLIESIQKHGSQAVKEIIVVDGGSNDNTLTIAQQLNATALLSPKRGRAAQMNHGANFAKGDVLYFVHADTRVPFSFWADILQALDEGYEAGCYRFKFDSDRFILKINSYFTRFNRLMLRGGDQTFFIKKTLFEALGGYDEHYVIMEEYDFLRRLWAKKQPTFKLIPKSVLVSARKYETNSWLRVQIANLTAVMLFRWNTDPSKIARIYKKMLNHR